MSTEWIGALGILVLLVLLVLRIPVAFSIFVVGLGGVAILDSPSSALSLLASETFTLASNAELIVIPLFILMGNVATEAGMSRKLYDAAYALIGSIRGGLASATVVGCAGFAALCGSSVASALTMGRVSLDEMKRYDYSAKLSTGAVAAGGTLGILIPPSTGFVIYAILTQQSIGRLFLAGVLPGLMLCLLFVIAITLMSTLKPALAPAGPKTSRREKTDGLLGAMPILFVILLTIGGIYTGIFSPVEAAAVGAGLMVLFGAAMRKLTLASFWRAAQGSISTTATVMLILIAAHMLNPFLALSHIPQALGDYLTSLDIGPYGVLLLILACYLVLGCFLEGFAMLVLTMPIFFPVITALGFDPIWFGVLVVLTLEMGLISPPVGVNVFIVKSAAPQVPLKDIFIGVMPFWLVMIVAILLMIVFPDIVLVLPNAMMG
ncbi:TRAP transporter large permease [Halomonas sp. McH1-25]|uniref:TRAP transporter large permease n=1 Tax=unclassified Halomonas TaxID=2609666 RepID=UPI001EF469E3|nr:MULTISPECIES: TRAP transporter large permease [unclassified Halomonas]MCG7601280.1 TRAP transporter large permease [Halomonas sp. McH1-25]MCP1343269.1 TRAP transporter large permease [Halomonas sp. FL8]MCP1360740.1 TRAP transporter large permease [Halomonas sp. BBD45]